MKWIKILPALVLLSLSSCNEKLKERNDDQKTRIEKWIEDIDYFEHQYLTESSTFSKDSIASCKQLLADLKPALDSLTDNQIILQLSRCVAMANNGHTTIHLSRMDKVPLRFYWFEDGLYVIKTDSSLQSYLGAKVLKINAIEIEDVQKKLNPYLSGIERWKKYTASNYLSSPEILNGIGLTERDSMNMTLLMAKDTINVVFGTKEMGNHKYEYETWSDLYPDSTETGWTHLLNTSVNQPLYLKHMNDGVFHTFLDSVKIAYFSINALWYKCSDFEDKVEKFIDKLKTKTAYDVVFDLRYYTGGDYTIPLDLATKPPKIIDDDRRIYLITSRMTFSAGLVTAARIKYFGKDKVVVVGEEVGDNMKFWAEGDYYNLPNSKIEIQDSKFEHDWQDDKFTLGKTYWINAFYGVPAGDLNVDKRIQLNFAQFINGKDPVLDWIINEVE